MVQYKNKLCAISGFVMLLIAFLLFTGTVFAQSKAKTEYDFPAGNFWALGFGAGMSGYVADGLSPHIIIDPKLWLSPAFMVGVKAGANYSLENNPKVEGLGDILILEGQAYLRWNFLRLGKNLDKKVNIFLQGGLGGALAYRGTDNPFNEVTDTRGSFMGEGALGITIPLTPRFHLEMIGRGGYPHLWGGTLSMGYKFPLPSGKNRTQYIDRTRPPIEIFRLITISAVEYVIFGPDIGSYNVGIDRDAQQLNELILNGTAQMLKEHPDYLVRIEGHANPLTRNVSEAEELMVLSNIRANVIAAQLKRRGVKDNQMDIISFGGTRNATNEWEMRNRNRRVELMIMHLSDE